MGGPVLFHDVIHPEYHNLNASAPGDEKALICSALEAHRPVRLRVQLLQPHQEEVNASRGRVA